MYSVVAVHQLNWIVTFLSSSFVEPTEISSAIRALTFSLARHSFFSPSIFLPPILTSMGGGVVTVQILDQSLADSDVLQEYMQRSNLIGWTTRSQFEELWMQLLGVLNTPIPDEGKWEELVGGAIIKSNSMSLNMTIVNYTYMYMYIKFNNQELYLFFCKMY